MISTTPIRTPYNIGADILKIFACFGVVWLHFGGGGCQVSVPIFMFLAAFYSYDIIEKGTYSGLRKRLTRLYVPFALWGCVYWCALGVYTKNWSMCDLIMQLTIGVPANPPMYFITLLVLNTLILFTIERMAGRGGKIACVLLMICLWAQYSGLNVELCDRMPFYPRNSIGRFVELLPPAIMAYLIRKSDKGLIYGLILSVVVTPISYVVKGLGCPGYSYQGVELLLWTLLIATATLLAGEALSCRVPRRCSHYLRTVSGLTAGIYYVHLLIGKLCEVPFGRHRGLLETFVVFLLSAVLVWVASLHKVLGWMVK